MKESIYMVINIWAICETHCKIIWKQAKRRSAKDHSLKNKSSKILSVSMHFYHIRGQITKYDI